jgi:hypothetical protein
VAQSDKSELAETNNTLAKHRPPPPKQPPPTAQPKTSPTESTTQSAPIPSRKLTFRQLAKKIAWRLTALYSWLWLVSLFLFGSKTVESAQSGTASKFVQLLSSIGFAPVNAAALPLVFKTGWLLTITGFNPMQILGLAIYLFSAPVWVFFLTFYSSAVPKTPATPVGLAQPQARWSALPLSTVAVVGWFVLYGAAWSRRELLVGTVLSGLLLVLFTYKALQRTKPLTILDVAVLGALERFGTSIPTSITTNEQKTPVAKRSQAAVNLVTYGLVKDAILFQARFVRGKRGKDRIYMFILLEYILFLFMLGLAAIFFWALVAKTLIAPQPIPLSSAFYFSAAHFLPGVSAPSLLSALPVWAQIGPSLTAWVIFVIFVGPAASVVPVRQAAYGARLTITYATLRHCSLFLSAYLRRMEKLKQTLTG